MIELAAGKSPVAGLYILIMNWQQLFQLFGYPLVALGIGLESMGVPAPGETILLIAAAASATGTGQIAWVVLAAATGAIIGDNIAFTLGQRYGRSLLTHVPFINEEKLAHSEVFFHKHGSKTVIIARFIPVVRSVVAYIAGINKMRHRTFTIYNLIGGLLWATIIGSLGFIFGKNLHLVELWLRRVGGIWGAILLVGGLLLWVNHRWYQDERRFRLGRTGTAWAWWQAGWQRLTRQGQRGLLVYGLLLILSGWATGVLLDDWVEREPELYQRDRLVTTWLQLGAEEVSPWTEALAGLGDVRVLAVITAVTAVFLWWRGQRRNSILTILTFAGALALGVGLQVWLKRPLPPSPEIRWQLTPYAFPHLSSLLAVNVYGWLAYLWQQERSWASRINGATIAVFPVPQHGYHRLIFRSGQFERCPGRTVIGLFVAGYTNICQRQAGQAGWSTYQSQSGTNVATPTVKSITGIDAARFNSDVCGTTHCPRPQLSPFC
ncbi:MAG: VTT domain-containing protein [Ardenticatenaceae bacterium]|nr:VTT domain-containing protein [Ardenticatenaceae bacterium]